MRKIKKIQWSERLGYTNISLDMIYNFVGNTLYYSDTLECNIINIAEDIATLKEAKIIAQKHFEELVMSCFEDE